ncbi:MAG: stage V sporulation protein SpoVM [Clostridiales bacterium]|nr:stage V sporulation protein SpoVM [Clostridiales bacterium]
MKIIVLRSPKFLSGLLKLVFHIDSKE